MHSTSTDWKQQKIKDIEEIQNPYFYHNAKTTYKTVPLALVTGSLYFRHYVGWTWEYMYSHLKRDYVTKTNCDAFIDFPKENNVDEVVYEQFGEDYFIISGHHRTCIAKFMGRQSVFVQVQEHEFDNELFSLYQQLIKYNFGIELQGSISNPRWQILAPPNTISLNGIAAIRSFCFYYSLLVPRLWETLLLQSSKFRDVIIPYNPYYQWDIDKVDHALRFGLLTHKECFPTVL
jgi:hypothetical protein